METLRRVLTLKLRDYNETNPVRASLSVSSSLALWPRCCWLLSRQRFWFCFFCPLGWATLSADRTHGVPACGARRAVVLTASALFHGR
jgi:hypothetical protein